MKAQHIASMFQRAALAPDIWLAALDAMASATHSYRGQLIGIGGNNAVPFNWVTNLDPSVTEEFVAIDGGNPAVSYRVAAGDLAQVGEIVAEDRYAAMKTRLGDNAYEGQRTVI